MRHITSLAVLASLSPWILAQEPAQIREILVIGTQESHTVVTDDTLVAPADTAQLLRKMPGLGRNLYGRLMWYF